LLFYSNLKPIKIIINSYMSFQDHCKDDDWKDLFQLIFSTILLIQEDFLFPNRHFQGHYMDFLILDQVRWTSNTFKSIFIIIQFIYKHLLIHNKE